MKKTAFLLMVLLAIVFQGSVDAQTALSRSVHVADGGLVFVTDVVPVASGTEVVRLGFPRDMLRNLAGYYLLGEEGQISTKVSNDVVWLEAAPKPSWKGSTVSVVTVWRNLLVEAPQDRYMLSVPANPIREKETAQLQLYLQIDGTASITSISGVELQTSADKSKANGTISNIPQNQFKTLTAFFESPDLLVYVLEEANILVDLETKTVTADLVFANLGNSAIASVDLKLGKTASVASARSGFVTLGTSWDGEKGILNVKLLQELQKNQKTRFQVVYASDAIFKRTADGIEVFPPNYVNASVSNYFLTIRTPPVSQISFSTEPWQLKVLDGDRREVTFKYTNIYVTSQQALTLRYVETFSIPVPAVLLVFIAFVAGFLVVRSVRTGKAGGEAAALKQFRRTYELEAENLMNEIEKFGLDDKQKKPLKNVDELLRPLKNTILEAKKNLKTPEAVQVCSAVEKAVDELSSTLQALNRLTEDYQSNRISRTVYRRIYKDYSRECRRILDSASKAFESFIPS